MRRHIAPSGCEYGDCRADAERGSRFCFAHNPITRIVIKNNALDSKSSYAGASPA